MTSSAPQGRAPLVTVRLWAAAKDAAGRGEVTLPAETLADLQAALRAEHDERMTRLLAVCSFLVDEHPVGMRRPADVALHDGAVVDVLPPFAGGSGAVVNAAPSRGTARRAVVAFGTVALTGVLLAAAGANSTAAVAVVVIAAQVTTVGLWHRVVGSKSTTSPVVPLAAAAAAGLAAGADALALTVAPPSLAPLVSLLGGSFLLVVLEQLARRGQRPAVVEAMASSLGLTSVVVLGAGWITLVRVDPHPLTAAGLALAVAGLTLLFGGRWGNVLPLIAAAGVGAAASAPLDLVLRAAVGVGLASGAAVVLVRSLAVAAVSRRAGGLLAGCSAVLLAGPLCYVALRALN